jgi:2-oxoglutarate ferredoxin oxidoreductase subunit delta
MRSAIEIDDIRCKGCGLCVAACTRDVLCMTVREVNVKGYHYASVLSLDSCTSCCSCGIVCPDGCISIYRAKSPRPPAGGVKCERGAKSRQ